MSTLGLHGVSREPVTTEWDDAQRRIGNLPPLESSAGEEEHMTALQTAAELPMEKKPSVVDAASSKENGEEDGVARLQAEADEDAQHQDQEELNRLRMQRLDELKGNRQAEVRFGAVAPLTHADYKREVCEAGNGVGVVVFLSKAKGHYLSSYMLVILEKLARKFGDVKFLNIESTECIPNYPDANLPTLLLYRDDDLLGQCVGPAAFGGSSFSIEDVEWELAQMKLVKTDLTVNPHGRDREKKR